jgi:hypothetical protein
MTTQTETSSPFENNKSTNTSAVSEQFTFRTMQDDLLSPQKAPIVSTATVTPTPTAINNPLPSTISIPKEQPSVDIQPKQAMPSPTAVQENFTPIQSNPFFDQMNSQPQTLDIINNVEDKKQSPIIKNIPVEIPTARIPSQDTSGTVYKIIISIIIILIIGIIGLGGYYFWITKSPQQVATTSPSNPVVEVVPPIETKTTEVPVIIAPPVEKYSATKPNYLVLDIAKISTNEIQTSLLNIANEIKDKPSKSLYEFIPVDINNNPIAFPIFAIATKLNFSKAVIASLDDSFSLFLYNDNGNVRLGLSTTTTKNTILTNDIIKEEKTLSKDIAFMFLGSTVDSTNTIFNKGSYNGLDTKYLNLNTQGTLSIDYAVKDIHFIIGTSKDTLRSIIDKTLVINQ